MIQFVFSNHNIVEIHINYKIPEKCLNTGKISCEQKIPGVEEAIWKRNCQKSVKDLKVYLSGNLLGMCVAVSWMWTEEKSKPGNQARTTSAQHVKHSEHLLPFSSNHGMLGSMADSVHNVGLPHSRETLRSRNLDVLQWLKADLTLALEGDIIFIIIQSKQNCPFSRGR